MRFTSLTLLSVVFITLVLAVPTPDKYNHFKNPGCPGVGTSSCLLLDYCNHHRKLGDLFTSRNGNFKSRDAPGLGNSDFNLTNPLSPSLPSFFKTRKLHIKWKRTSHSVECGVLSCIINNEVSDWFSTLVAKVLYDLIIDYPYHGATRSKSRLLLLLPTLFSIF